MQRAKRTRMRIRDQGVYRLSVHRTPRHIYAQVIDPSGGRTVSAASTLDSALKSELAVSGNAEAAAAVGKAIAQKTLDAGVDQVAFDRSGFGYHGRVKALAEAARENGLKF